MTADATFTSWEIQRCPRTISPAQTEHLEAPSADHLLICDFLFHHVTLAVLTFVWMASMGVRCRWCITFIGRRKTWLYHNTEGKKQKKTLANISSRKKKNTRHEQRNRVFTEIVTIKWIHNATWCPEENMYVWYLQVYARNVKPVRRH